MLQNINGIKQSENSFFNVDGYQIWIEVFPETLNKKSIKHIKNQFLIKSDDQLSHETLDNVIKFTWKEEDSKTGITSNSYYLYETDYNHIQIVGFSTNLTQDFNLETTFLKALINDLIPKHVYSSWVVDSIKFAGRQIPLGPVCNWKSPNNIQCPRYGQMNWSEFYSYNRAVEMIKKQIINSDDNVLSENTKAQIMDVEFEGVDTKALRIEKHVNLPKLIMAGSNNLIIYYIVAKVRNRYVSCVLSHYDDEADKGELSELLKKTMKLKKY
jgi:hypothetical protein